MNKEQFVTEFYQIIDIIISWAVSPKFYAQIIAIAVAVLAALFISVIVKKRVPFLKTQPEAGALLALKRVFFLSRHLVFPAFCVLLLAIATEISLSLVEQSWLVKIAQGLAVILLLYSIISLFITNTFINGLFKWIGIPVAILHVFGWLDETTVFLDGLALSVGNIRLSAYVLLRVFVFGSILFWLGRISNSAGQKAIRNKESLDLRTREVFSKLFEICLYIAVGLLLLQIVGLDLTALAVFGGALGVGLGFGLQQIASNFISGIIILLDRSLTVGDYIELEEGKSGFLRELNMRSSTLQTFEGKTIVVPNEQFITTAFTNWTHQDNRQRYEFEFSVSYDTDAEKVPDVIIPAISAHPQVLQEPELPDCEIRDFADSGIVFGVEYWIDGIDDGQNRVDSDLRMIIWKTLKENGIKMPYPQREVRILKH